jgi:hypothetical protein
MIYILMVNKDVEVLGALWCPSFFWSAPLIIAGCRPKNGVQKKIQPAKSVIILNRVEIFFQTRSQARKHAIPVL